MIEITDRKSGNVVYLNAVHRKQLITGAKETYQTRFDGTGELIGTDSQGGYESHIVVRTSEYGSMNIPVYPPQTYEAFACSLTAMCSLSCLLSLIAEIVSSPL